MIYINFAHVLFCFTYFVTSDILYSDFNDTTGLQFNGDTGTTNCFDFKPNFYGDVQGKADKFSEILPVERKETSSTISEVTIETNGRGKNLITKTLAEFGHRNDTISSPTACSVRTRLTPSGPSKAGSMWYRESVPVSNGFDTYFTFQISDHSQECTLHKDQYFSLIDYKSCSVHGGDGFAFVIQNDPNSTFALGGVGGEMGFGGIHNSLAIAFDMFYNPGAGMDSMGVDHVSIQSRGAAPNSAQGDGLLGVPMAYDMADGKVHLVRVVYHGELKPEYFSSLIASDSLIPYLKDNGEQKRVGTLLVYVDEGVETDKPLLAIPINLSVVLDMPVDKAFVGFTGSTGRYFEKHDILSWYFCDQEPCEKAEEAYFNYYHSANLSIASLRTFSPGPGFGGSDGSEGFPTKQQSPDTTPWSTSKMHFSLGRNEGLAEDAALQTPPDTTYRRL
mmetsp:Transcript_25436/g.24326  ORF Transcript_25436/g.24326 Transcript_25436/m.24326 type:complete len:447 (-) Transcript_25436:165-1505(-)|eukprot:CAMPEP_0119052036 /NCGR_PEP_ID=MMETSP1177-20130426/73468_1 /TAXON_ID=2985 /ORGANISM="Ochromonas sp, Strain CCMP1899" /LENGTH=446 /DNA_ID=CAMNT_0007031471 /DNA_START=145 /DNA_END=1485 /DNA_ORIENTATION=+